MLCRLMAAQSTASPARRQRDLPRPRRGHGVGTRHPRALCGCRRQALARRKPCAFRGTTRISSGCHAPLPPSRWPRRPARRGLRVGTSTSLRAPGRRIGHPSPARHGRVRVFAEGEGEDRPLRRAWSRPRRSLHVRRAAGAVATRHHQPLRRRRRHTDERRCELRPGRPARQALLRGSRLGLQHRAIDDRPPARTRPRRPLARPGPRAEARRHRDHRVEPKGLLCRHPRRHARRHRAASPRAPSRRPRQAVECATSATASRGRLAARRAALRREISLATRLHR